MGTCGGPRSSLLRRLSDEDGIALIMAMAVMLVLTVLVTSTLAFTSSNSRDSSRSTAAQKAYAGAEAGLNDALAAVQNAGSDTTQMASQANPTVTTLTGGATATWYGTYNASTKVWTLTSTGSVPDPTGGPSSFVTRTITQTATITPPPYSFVALNTSCDNHTLLVETGGQLTVTNAMYIDSCNSPQDAFDIFGAGGNITDPVGITVVGGWETHDGSTVTAKGTQCPLSNSTTPLTATQPAGCPVTGQSVLADPLAPKLTTTPTLGTPACTGGSVVQGQAYNPAVTLNSGPGGLSNSATSVPVQWTSGSDPIAVNDVILIDTEQMRVTAITPGSGPGGSTKATLTVTRAYNSTTASTHANGASDQQINNYDIALESTASTGTNGTLGSISGSIYAPANRADFVDELSGTANLAVLSSCILIDGGNSTFAFNPTGLFAHQLGPRPAGRIADDNRRSPVRGRFSPLLGAPFGLRRATVGGWCLTGHGSMRWRTSAGSRWSWRSR